MGNTINAASNTFSNISGLQNPQGTTNYAPTYNLPSFNFELKPPPRSIITSMIKNNDSYINHINDDYKGYYNGFNPASKKSVVQNMLDSSSELDLPQLPSSSSIMSLPIENPKPVEVPGQKKTPSGDKTEGFGNMKNQILGMGINMLGQQLGSNIGGKFGDDIGSIGSVVGQQILENGNLKGLFSGGSGQALGGIGYNMLNKFMGGDKNKDVGSKLLTDFGAMAWQINPTVGAITTGVMALNNLTGKSTHKFEGNSWQSQEVQSALGGSYGNSMATIKNAQGREGHMGGLGRITGELSRSNRRIDRANTLLDDMATIYDTRELGQIRGQNMADINSLDYRLNTFGGYDQYGTRIGRKGMKLPSKQDIDKIRQIISFKGGGKRKYNEHYNGEKCDTDQCAQFSNGVLRDELGYGTYGNAWNLGNVKLIFNGYNTSARPKKYNLNEVVAYNHDASNNVLKNFKSNEQLDPEQVYVVNMYYNGSPAQEEAYNNGRDKTAGTHTGYLYNNNGVWKVAHNIHGKLHVDDFFNIQGGKQGKGQYGVTAIYKPTKSGLFGWGFLGLKNGGTIEQFKKGGQMNVIPDGALHARLHHMETDNKITKKGIPVVDKNGEQQAEIERNEIIFSLEVTNKLEELRKDGSDKAALEAGKLLVDEIFNNTDDRTGLIQEVIGTDEANKPVFKEGGIIAEMPKFIIQAEEPEMDSDEDEPVGIEEVEYYQSGGKKRPLYIKDVYNPSIRTEGDIIYNAETDEQKAHEVGGHFNPNKRLLKDLEPYYLDLNDEKLLNFGADLDFIKRNENDPNYFYSPEELLGRIEASRQSVGDSWWKLETPSFFKELKETDENKYGDNLRDLLHMYNPETLAEMFKIASRYSRTKFQTGGIIAEMPDGSDDEVEEYQEGGIIEQINKLPADKLKELENILKYLNHD